MSDDKNERKPQDSQRVNVNEDYELEYWSKALNTTKESLRNAVKKVGVMVEDVRRELQNRPRNA